MLLPTLREDVLETAKQMVTDRLTYGTSGNISALDPDSGLIAVTPSAIEYPKMSIEDIVVIDRQGKIIEGKWAPTSETPLHTIFYRESDDVGAVVHTHSHFASVFAVTGEPVPMVLTEAAMCIGAPVRVSPYQRPGTPELAHQALESMGNDVAILLAQHGALAVGPDLRSAYSTAVAMEVCARTALLARCTGAVIKPIDPNEVAELRRCYLKNYRPKATSA